MSGRHGLMRRDKQKDVRGKEERRYDRKEEEINEWSVRRNIE